MTKAIAYATGYHGPNLLRGADPGELLDADDLPGGQGWQADPAARKAVEKHAMGLAERFFRARGYGVDSEVHRYQPYDLFCTHRRTGEVLRVEVKGTTTRDAHAVLVTAGEVQSARATDVGTALFVVSEVSLSRLGNRWRARGGTAKWARSWRPSDRDLAATAYRYRLPRLERAR